MATMVAMSRANLDLSGEATIKARHKITSTAKRRDSPRLLQ